MHADNIRFDGKLPRMYHCVLQVLAMATFGCSPGIQYCQLLLSLASLNAISMVDVTLNSRFYHARFVHLWRIYSDDRKRPGFPMKTIC